MESEFTINFTDITLNEADGVFSEVEEIMSQDIVEGKHWVLRSSVTIMSKTGDGSMNIQCGHDRQVYILDYDPSIGDLHYNPDIQAISVWAQESGWKIPQPHPNLIKENKEFWKYFYDTLIIDSDYFDKLYGGRPQIEADVDVDVDKE